MALAVMTAFVICGGIGAANTGGRSDAAAASAKNVMDFQSDRTGKEKVSCGKIALTFDDGPDARYTGLLLDGLKERNVPATFFVTGERAEQNPKLILRMKAEGHLIGNHTYSHIQLKKGQEDVFQEELQKTNDIIERITGEGTEFVRPPYGTWEKKFERELNMIPVLWTIDPLDWCSDNADRITRNVVAEAKENDIILLHDQYKSSVTAAFAIVDTLQEKGYEFVTVEEILFD